MQNLDELINKISSNELFLRLKNVVENVDGWHDHEDVFSHSVKTGDFAKNVRGGEFISNPHARELFAKWIDEDLFGMKKKDIGVLIALLHDCGKILKYKEGDREETLITRKPSAKDQTLCPGHEYWGGEIVVREILRDSGLDTRIIDHISKVIKLHDAFSAGYFKDKQQWSVEDIIIDMKARAEGYYKEVLFNMYCDGYTAPAFEAGKARIKEIFNSPSFYSPRTYFIP